MLAAEPRVAAFYGVELDRDGSADADAVAALSERLVVIVIEI